MRKRVLYLLARSAALAVAFNGCASALPAQRSVAPPGAARTPQTQQTAQPVAVQVPVIAIAAAPAAAEPIPADDHDNEVVPIRPLSMTAQYTSGGTRLTLSVMFVVAVTVHALEHPSPALDEALAYQGPVSDDPVGMQAVQAVREALRDAMIAGGKRTEGGIPAFISTVMEVNDCARTQFSRMLAQALRARLGKHQLSLIEPQAEQGLCGTASPSGVVISNLSVSHAGLACEERGGHVEFVPFSVQADPVNPQLAEYIKSAAAGSP